MSRASREARAWKVLRDNLGIFYTHQKFGVLERFARLVARKHPENDYLLYDGFILWRKR